MTTLMRASVFLFFIFLSSLVFAESQMLYQQKQLPDGTLETEYTSSDGSKLKQVHQTDGTIKLYSVDAAGNETVTIQEPNGNVEVKTQMRN